ncbi:hypothetical protein SAMN02745215_04296 [Desulfitobacterium chlororespirans DSM 11544]|uniref:ABC-2 type transport system permease protein n=2 Tax=Desulfitobacterium chlororespirans TaxID=51616 RepID=A0A1M7UPA5_9FIRM|nr:hypothetical protein SAMN02745215_04296 [Desulfitobacterium chlororespirans DSM 11544]
MESIHPRFVLDEQEILFYKAQTWRFSYQDIARIIVRPSAFIAPHLLLGTNESTVTVGYAVTVPGAERYDAVPRDLLGIMNAMSDESRMKILRQVFYHPYCTQQLADMLVGGVHLAGWWSVPLGLLILAVSAVIWGGFLNVIFLFSRDSGFLYTILDEPMLIFSGVRIPVAALPYWGKLIALVFPLTYVLEILRNLVIEGYGFTQILPSLGGLLAVLAVLCLLSSRLVILAEKHALRTGNLNLF